MAVSGLAKRFQSDLDDDYIAGLWKKDLGIQLCWKGQGIVPDEYRAPSWSWASVDGPITMTHLRLSSLLKEDPSIFPGFQVEDVTVQYGVVGGFGEVSSAILRVSCEVFARTKFSNIGKWYVVFEDDTKCHIARLTFNRVETDCIYDLDREGHNNLIYVMPVLQGPKRSNLYALMLEKVTEEGEQFRRIGVLSIDEDSLEEFMEGIMANLWRRGKEGHTDTHSKQGREIRYQIENI